MPFLFKNRFSLNEVEKVGRRTVRFIVSLVCSADAVPFDVHLLLIDLILGLSEAGHVFEEVDFAAGIKLGEGQSFSGADGEATPTVSAERLFSNPTCGILK